MILKIVHGEITGDSVSESTTPSPLTAHTHDKLGQVGFDSCVELICSIYLMVSSTYVVDRNHATFICLNRFINITFERSGYKMQGDILLII